MSRFALRFRLREALLAWAFVTLVGALAICRWASLDPAPAPTPEQVGALIDGLRAVAEGRPAPALDEETAARRLPGAARVVLWSKGRPVFRGEYEARTLGELAEQAAPAVEEARGKGRFDGRDLSQARFQISFVVAEGPVLSWPAAAAAISFVTTLDGAALKLEDRTLRLYPDDLLRRKLYSSWVPLPGGQMKAGLDAAKTIDALWTAAHLDDDQWEKQDPTLLRFRTAEFVERPGALPAPLTAGRVINPPPQTTGELVAAALDGVRWLETSLQPGGRFRYDYDPLTDGPSDPGYSLPRHAGSAYFLSFAHRKTGDPIARDAARRALDYLVERELRTCGKAPGKCVGQGGMVDAGSAALTLVAMAEYERGTHEGRYLEPLKQVLEFLLWLQEKNGDFVHLYEPGPDVRRPDRLLYYSGEATLAVVEAYRVLQDPKLLEPMRAALDFLTTENWSFFGSAYFFGEEHWTCIAANEAFPEVQSDAYLEFCEDFSAFLRAMQTEEGEGPFGFEGTYVITPFLAPRTTPVAGRTESTVATYKLGEAMGRPNAVILEQVRRSVTFLIRMRYTADSSPAFSEPLSAAGGMPGGFDDPVVRIDYVQHAGNALLGAADILGDVELTPPGWEPPEPPAAP